MAKTSDVVADNVCRFREAKGWNFAQLSRELNEVGHPLAITVLQRIEAGARRIDMDDLTAFAAVLNVSVTQLLDPRADDELDAVMNEREQLAGLPAVTGEEAAAWLAGNLPEMSLSARKRWTAAQVQQLRRASDKIEKRLEKENPRTPEGYELLGESLRIEQSLDYWTRRAGLLSGTTTSADESELPQA